MGRVDAGLAANGRIDLGQKRGWNLDELDAAPEDGCGKAGDVANDAATEGNDFVAPFNAGGEQLLAQTSQCGEALGFFAGGQNDGYRFDTRRRQGRFQRFEMVARHVFIGDDCGEGPVEKRRNVAAGFLQQVVPDVNVIGTLPEIDGYDIAAPAVSLLHCLAAPNPAIWPKP